MKAKLLIEKENARTWRVVIRECTERGLSQTKFNVVGSSYPNLPAARTVFDGLTGYKLKPSNNPRHRHHAYG